MADRDRERRYDCPTSTDRGIANHGGGTACSRQDYKTGKNRGGTHTHENLKQNVRQDRKRAFSGTAVG